MPGPQYGVPAGSYPAPTYPVHPPPPAPAAKRKTALTDRRWWAVGGAVALVAVLGGVALAHRGGTDATTAGPTSTTAAQVPAVPVTTMQAEPPPPSPSAAPPAPPAPTVATDALPGLLLSAEEVGQRLNTPGMTSIPVESNLLLGTITPANCSGVWAPVYASTYNGSGFTGLAVQGVFLQPTVKVAQAVVAFPDPGAAKAFFDKQVADWSACKSSHISFRFDGPTNEVDVGVPAMSGDVMTVGLTSSNSQVANQKCERALTARGNVIVDVRACSPSINSGGYDIASDIAAKIR